MALPVRTLQYEQDVTVGKSGQVQAYCIPSQEALLFWQGSRAPPPPPPHTYTLRGLVAWQVEDDIGDWYGLGVGSGSGSGGGGGGFGTDVVKTGGDDTGIGIVGLGSVSVRSIGL